MEQKGITFVLIFSSAVAVISGVYLFQRKVSAAPVSYTIYQHLAAKTDSPNPITVETRTVAQRGDGSHVELKQDLRNPFQDRLIVLVPNGLQLKVYDEVKAVSTMKVNTSTYLTTWGLSMDPKSGCTRPYNGLAGEFASTVVATENLQGIVANKVQTGPTFFVWMAPALGCQEVQHEVTWSQDSPPSTTRLYLDRVVWGEPDPALFTVPASYQEMKPSDAVRTRLTSAGRTPERVQAQVDLWSRMDPKYLANRP